MHILSGDFKGTTLEVPKQAITRPTSSKMRAQLFNMNQHRIGGAHFLDLFAGSGAMGLEALSRGAETAYFIDHDIDAIRVIQKNILKCKLSAQQAHCIHQDVLQAILKIKLDIEKGKIAPFDIIFMDPPYYQKNNLQSEELILLQKLLSFFDTELMCTHPESRLFLEESAFCPVTSIPLHNWQLQSTRGTKDSLLYEFNRR